VLLLSAIFPLVYLLVVGLQGITMIDNNSSFNGLRAARDKVRGRLSGITGSELHFRYARYQAGTHQPCYARRFAPGRRFPRCDD
jgi:hypothetical protein